MLNWLLKHWKKNFDEVSRFFSRGLIKFIINITTERSGKYEKKYRLLYEITL
jgi:hypothetical protein